MQEHKTWLTIYDAKERDHYLHRREGETRLGEQLMLLPEEFTDLDERLKQAALEGARYALLGIPEDIGVRANSGRPGARDAWSAFCTALLNVQDNRFLSGKHVLWLGHITVADLQAQAEKTHDLASLRKLCADLDKRVTPVIASMVAAGLIPIVIGGGHNNAYPIIRGTVKGLQETSLAVLNIDAHADFRSIEGRHSGNPFRYADCDGLLAAYQVLGLHELYVSQAVLQDMEDSRYPYACYEAWASRGEQAFAEVWQASIDYLKKSAKPVGLELDVDAIADMPASAKTPYGLSHEQVATIINQVTKQLHPRYFHLAEAAPSLGFDGERTVGRALVWYVANFIKAYDSKNAFIPSTLKGSGHSI